MMTARNRLSLVLGLLVLSVSGCTFRPETPALSFDVEPLTAARIRVSAILGWASYEWTFGDEIAVAGRTATHTYDAPGEYTINLKAISLDGSPAYAHTTVTVRRDIYVSEDSSLPRDYATVQLAVEAAEPGDMLLIQGEHTENIVIDKALTLRGPCTLTSATANPAVHVSVDGVTLQEVTFAGAGEEATAGGGLRLTSADIEVIECAFENHSGHSGGAVYVMESRATFTACVFSGNEADVDGGAVYCEGDRSFPAFIGCRFSDNRANAGGGIAIRATTAVALHATPLRVEDSVFERNLAGSALAGGAVHIGHSCRAALAGNTYSANGPLDVVFE